MAGVSFAFKELQMKKNSKISWIDGSEKPSGEAVTYDPKDQRLLLVLLKGNPLPQIAIYNVTTIRDTEKRDHEKIEYWHVLHYVDVEGVPIKIVAWRPLPKIPTEYHGVTGYDKVLEYRESPKARKIRG